MVDRIEQYGNTLKVILEPTKAFPVGYFYCDADAIDLVKNYSWCLNRHDNNIYVIAKRCTPNTGLKILRFHQEYAKKILGYYPDYLDHIDGLEIDNRDRNLNVVSQQQNIRNRPSIGYQFKATNNRFQPKYALNGKNYIRNSYKTEPEALLATYQLRQEVYADYNYSFLEDRRGFESLLDLEVKGVVSHEEANYLRAKELIKSNAWYVYRYNLFDYCKENNIKIPNFGLDSQGFMINPNTGLRLCPY